MIKQKTNNTVVGEQTSNSVSNGQRLEFGKIFVWMDLQGSELESSRC
jgi:hypothetical protein